MLRYERKQKCQKPQKPTHTHTHTHTRVVLLSLFLLTFNFCASAETGDLVEQVKYKEELVKQLKDEISQIDSEMTRCQKAKNGWVTATVVGGVGVVATGTAAIVQTVQLNKKKKEISEQKEKEK